MAHPPRQYHEGYWYHVYHRSLPELRLFASDAERQWFIDKLNEVFVRRNLKMGALCLMDSHYHALVKMGPIPLDRALNGLHMAYVKHVNATRNRRGSLLETRPGADIVLDDAYLLQLVPYIHQNPVKAGLVKSPANYEWHTDSMYRRGQWEKKEFQCWEFPPHFDDADRSEVYRERMNEEIEELEGAEGYIGDEVEWENIDRRKDDRGTYPRERRGRLGKDEITRQIADENDTTVEKVKQAGRSQPEAGIRQEAMARMYEEGYGPTEIGQYFNRDKGTVMHAVNKKEDE